MMNIEKPQMGSINPYFGLILDMAVIDDEIHARFCEKCIVKTIERELWVVEGWGDLVVKIARQANEVILGIKAHENPWTEKCEFPENLGEETPGKCSCRLEMEHLRRGKVYILGGLCFHVSSPTWYTRT